MLAGVKPWSGAWTQAAIDARWLEIGGTPETTPIIPASLEGCTPAVNKGGVRQVYCKGKPPRFVASRAENQFIEMWTKIAIDPYRKQSSISKVAGGIIQAAALVFPAAGVISSITTRGQSMLDAKKAAKDTEQITQALTTAAQTRALATPASLESPPASIDPVTGKMLTEFAPSILSPATSAALVPINASAVTPVRSSGRAGVPRVSPRDVLVAAGALTLLYLLLKR